MAEPNLGMARPKSGLGFNTLKEMRINFQVVSQATAFSLIGALIRSETIALGQCSLVRCVASLWFESPVLRLQGPSAMVSLEN